MGVSKILVIGLDGTTFRLILPWIAAGELPNLGRVQRTGSCGSLRSTVRPESSVAWSSFATGVNPGKHGVFGFAHVLPDYGVRINTAQSVQAPCFWQIAGQFDRNVGLINIPMTYPPQPVNGFMVSGMLTPSTQSQFTYPPDLRSELLSTLGDYIVNVGDISRGKGAFVEALDRCIELRCEATLYLMRSRPWDLFVSVFTESDRIQHFLWSDMDTEHPRRSVQDGGRFGQAILQHYRQLDAILGKLWRQAGDDAVIIVLSDHGFNGFHKTLFLNAWLHQMGLMNYTVTPSTDRRIWTSRLRHSTLLRYVKRNLPFVRDMRLTQVLRHAQFARRVDWPHTRAFFSEERAIRINLVGREAMGIVQPGEEYDRLREQIIQQLLALRDPETGATPIEAVYRREELYEGPFLDKAPDLIVEPKRSEPKAVDNYVLSPALEAEVFGIDNPRSGNHDLEGIFMASGPGIRSGLELKGAHIVDVAPTILHAMAIPIPEDMDGRPLKEIFDSSFIPPQDRGGTSSISRASPAAGNRVFSEADEQEVLSRLRNLGYLD